MKKVVLFFISFIFHTAIAQDFTLVELPAPESMVYPYSEVEPSIAIHPKKKKIMVAGSILNNYYFSLDKGKNWESKSINSPYGVYGDPVMEIDKNGKVYFFHLASYDKTTHLDRIVCQTAEDAKSDFNKGSFPKPNGAKVQDKQWTVINQKNNHIYMTWTQFDGYESTDPKDSSIIVFSKSMDDGASWTEPKRISFYGGDCLDGDNTVEGAVPAVGPNGDIYVTWTGPKGLVFQKSTDEGETWLEVEKFIDRQYEGWDLDIPGLNRANGLPILKCDLSRSKNKGTLYLNWCDQKNGVDDTDVWLMKSTDGGESWSKRIKVNQDNSKKHQFFTWMDIDQKDGSLYFIYYDRRNYADNQTDVFLSSSFDGGNSFHDIKISDSSFTPREEVFFGDYLNISANKGIVRPIWPRLDGDEISLWIALVDKKGIRKKCK